MNKIVYWIGIYAICIELHDILAVCAETINEKHEKHSREKEQKKRPIGVQPEPVRKPVNKIGFQINSEQGT